MHKHVCDHEYNDHRGHDCGCGHNHEYAHHHEHHDPNCTDSAHHHHNHNHELVYISHHENSVIGALKGVMPVADYDEAEMLLSAQMREAAHQIIEAGGIIGHIKFVLTSTGRCGQISVTDINESIRRFDGTTSQVEGVVIVFAIEDDLLVEILEETIGSLLE